MNIHDLEKSLGYTFVRSWYLTQALTHRSFAAENNERLEFLGDTVLNLAITHCLFDRFPTVSEGELSRARATLVRQETLHLIAIDLQLPQYMRLGDGEIKSGGHARASMLADMVEAILGAIFLDGGYLKAFEVVGTLYANIFKTFEPGVRLKDAKSLLQETLQAAKLALPEYTLLTTGGAAHLQTFQIQCKVGAWGVQATGEGASRKIAEQEAAKAVLLLQPKLPHNSKRTVTTQVKTVKPKQLKLKVAKEQTPT